MLTRFPFLGPRSVFPGFKFPPDDHFRDEKLPKDYLSVSYFGPNFRFVKGPTLPFIPAVARANTRLRLHVSPERPALVAHFQLH